MSTAEKLKDIRRRAGKNRIAYLFLAPFFILFFIFTVVPVIISLFLSLTAYNMLQPPRFIGIGNYLRLFFSDDTFFLALRNTIVYAIITGPAGYIASFLVAWFINEMSPRIRSVIILLFYAPSISGTVYMIWKLIFSNDAYGYVNGILMRLGIIDAPILWLQSEKYVLTVVILVALWLSLGTSFLAFVAGLQGVDRSLYEAAAIDGVRNRWQEMWFVTLPSMRPQLMFGAVMSITGAFSVGDLTANLAGMPSVKYAAHMIVNHMVDYGTIRFEMGYASAIATVLFLLMVGTNKIVQSALKKIGD